MIELNRKNNNCIVFTDNIDGQTIAQLINLLNQNFVKNSQIRIMPDCHTGKGCVIGTTMTIQDKVVPNLVGSDIGCGVLTVKLMDNDIDFKKLDSIIRNYIPHGASLHQKTIRDFSFLDELKLNLNSKIQDKIRRSLGTLGGGNHFIEIDRNCNGDLYLLIHTGSRTLGKEVCDFYQNKAIEINKTNNNNVPDELAYLSEEDFLNDYLCDADIASYFAKINRETIANTIMDKMNLSPEYFFDTIHNYIDTKTGFLRKGAVSAEKNQKLIIPLNMRDGAIICKGKGNPDWNFSAPHGAGRLFSRSQAKEMFSLEEFQQEMKDIFTTSVKKSTLDESPMAYKNTTDIINNITDTVTIIEQIVPVYNFKAN